MKKTTGERIKELREKKNLTQVELGAELGITGTTIHNYERDTHIPGLKNIRKLSNFYGRGE